MLNAFDRVLISSLPLTWICLVKSPFAMRLAVETSLCIGLVIADERKYIITVTNIMPIIITIIVIILKRSTGANASEASIFATSPQFSEGIYRQSAMTSFSR